MSVILTGRPVAQTIYHPDYVATIFFDGIDGNGPSATGVVGVDKQEDLLDEIAGILGRPVGHQSPGEPAQLTTARYYGDTYPDYYSSADRAEVDAITLQYGGGIPRYAAIMAKFCRQVMARSGARQVNVLGGSMGALVARWMIEKDSENLASSGKIARFISIEGVIAGVIRVFTRPGSGSFAKTTSVAAAARALTYFASQQTTRQEVQRASGRVTRQLALVRVGSIFRSAPGPGRILLRYRRRSHCRRRR